VTNEILKAALYYASIGWKIVALAPGQKIPITKNGIKDATTDVSKINEWWAKWPSANIGLACGPESGVYVLDIDIKDNINGFDSLKEFPTLPVTVCQDTPRGGKHYLYRADVAPANRNNFRPGVDVRCEGYYIVLAPSTHPNGGIYAWAGGHAPWEIVLSAFPEFMRPTTRAPWGNEQAQVAPIVPIRKQLPISTDILNRASLYLAQCDPAIQGSCGHNKLLWAAVALVHGFLLSDKEAFDLLAREYNPRCSPPWDLSIQKDHKDFYRKISEARKVTPQNAPGWLLNDSAYSEIDTSIVDVEKLLGKKSPQATCATENIYSVPLPVGLPSQDQEYQFLIRPTGLLGEICSWINSTAIKEQPFLALACTLSFLGALFGRKVRDQLGSRTNLYCMGVAPSSAGKAHAMNQTRRLAIASGCNNLIGGSDIASDSAIEERVRREPSTLFMLDEIGHLLSHIKSGISKNHAQVVATLMRLYSAAGSSYLGKEYAEQERQRTILQPCCSIYGTSTIERFTSGLSPMELQDGWLSRCLVFSANGSVRKKRGRMESPVPQSLIDQVNAWHIRTITSEGNPIVSQFVNPSGGTQPPEQIVVPTSSEAERIFVAFDDECEQLGQFNPMMVCQWAKAEENARRIALIIACGENFDKPEISASVANYSCRLIRYIMRAFDATVVPDIVTGDTELQKRKLFKIIENTGIEGCIKREITRRSQDLRKNDRSRLLDDLIESGEIAMEPYRNGTALSVRFWTAALYLKKITNAAGSN